MLVGKRYWYAYVLSSRIARCSIWSDSWVKRDWRGEEEEEEDEMGSRLRSMRREVRSGRWSGGMGYAEVVERNIVP